MADRLSTGVQNAKRWRFITPGKECKYVQYGKVHFVPVVLGTFVTDGVQVSGIPNYIGLEMDFRLNGLAFHIAARSGTGPIVDLILIKRFFPSR